MLAAKRLTRELKMLREDPPTEFIIRCDEKNILTWYFVLFGSPETPYEGGMYLGELNFYSNYPFVGPHFIMHTPSGRFTPGQKICTSTSAFHASEYTSSLTIRTLLMGFLSFMNEKSYGLNSVTTSVETRKSLAKSSEMWTCGHPIYKEYFA